MQSTNKLIIKQDQSTHLVALESIHTIQFEDKKIIVTTDDHKYEMANKTLNTLEALLPKNSFVRIHHNCIINIARIKSINYTKMLIHTDTDLTIPLSIRKKKNLKDTLKTVFVSL